MVWVVQVIHFYIIWSEIKDLGGHLRCLGYSLCQGVLVYNKKKLFTDNYAMLVLFISGMSRMD